MSLFLGSFLVGFCSCQNDGKVLSDFAETGVLAGRVKCKGLAKVVFVTDLPGDRYETLAESEFKDGKFSLAARGIMPKEFDAEESRELARKMGEFEGVNVVKGEIWGLNAAGHKICDINLEKRVGDREIEFIYVDRNVSVHRTITELDDDWGKDREKIEVDFVAGWNLSSDENDTWRSHPTIPSGYVWKVDMEDDD